MSNLGSNLSRVDWASSGELVKFEKNFYREHPNVTSRAQQEIDDFRKEHEMTVIGSNIPRPIKQFEEADMPCKSCSPGVLDLFSSRLMVTHIFVFFFYSHQCY
jgi:hypothetical protein